MSITFGNVQDQVSGYYHASDSLKRIKEVMDRHHLTGWLFGGVIRDLVTDRVDKIRDLDVIAEGDYADFENASEHFKMCYQGVDKPFKKGKKKTGGSGEDNTAVSVMVEGMPLDLWHVSKQRVLNELPITSQIAAYVPGTTFLSTESIVCTFGPSPGHVAIHDDGFVDSINDRHIRCRMKHLGTIVKEHHAIKAAVQAVRLGFSMEADLANFVRETIGNIEVQALLALQRQRYGEVVVGKELAFLDVGLAQDVEVFVDFFSQLPAKTAVKMTMPAAAVLSVMGTPSSSRCYFCNRPATGVTSGGTPTCGCA